MAVEVPKHIKTPSELIHWFANTAQMWHPGFQEGLIRGAQEMLRIIREQDAVKAEEKVR